MHHVPVHCAHVQNAYAMKRTRKKTTQWDVLTRAATAISLCSMFVCIGWIARNLLWSNGISYKTLFPTRIRVSCLVLLLNLSLNTENPSPIIMLKRRMVLAQMCTIWMIKKEGNYRKLKPFRSEWKHFKCKPNQRQQLCNNNNNSSNNSIAKMLCCWLN